ncbi:MAG: acyltransferase [Betaproteobacteria bacterium]
MVRTLVGLFCSLIEWFIREIPGPTGRNIRRFYYRRRLGSLGPGVVIDCGVRIENPKWVHIGANSWIDHNVIILASPPLREERSFHRKFEVDGVTEGEVRIGSDCHIAPFVVLQGHGGLSIADSCGVASGAKIYSLSHHYRNIDNPEDHIPYLFTPMAPLYLQSLISAPVKIGRGAAIGLNAVVLPGSIIGDGTWVASGSIISGAVEKDRVVSVPPREYNKSKICDSEAVKKNTNPQTTLK